MSEPQMERHGDHGEIVIVRRHGHCDEEHHGGVWKVAFADFMTAMMAFFLVMWLINAANEETKVQVASYFNPVKLVDTTTNPRGLKEDPKSSSGDVENEKLKNEAKAKVADSGKIDEPNRHQTPKKGPVSYFSGGDIPESELFRDPVRTLNRIAGGAPDLLAGSAEQRNPETIGAEGGDAFRDPYAPRTWEMLDDDLPPEEAASAEGGPKNPTTRRTAPVAASQQDKKTSEAKALKVAEERTKGKDASARARNPEAHKRAVAGRSTAGGDERTRQTSKTTARASTPMTAAEMRRSHTRQAARIEDLEKEVAKLRAALKKALAGSGGLAPEVTVKRVEEGVLISISDKAGFGMFAIGSARPLPQTVRFMEKVAKILKSMPGRIIVRGHTDARPYRSKTYDNWRLSTARAHMARYMLIRGGLPESRFVRVEGLADREPAVPDDPLDARNRRIEILLKRED